jgi:hypothetical protein
MTDVELKLELERPGATLFLGERIRGVARARFGVDLPSNRTLVRRLPAVPELEVAPRDEVLHRVPVLLRPSREASVPCRPRAGP